MNMIFKIPQLGKLTDALAAAGIKTASARGFWGGVNADGEIIVTAWLDQRDNEGNLIIWRPNTNHGGLKDQWDIGNIRVGTEVRVILVRQRGNLREGEAGRSVSGAALLPGKWRVVRMRDGVGRSAAIEPVTAG